MEKSYQEILRLLSRLGRKPDGFAHRGSRSYLTDPEDLVTRAMARGPDTDPLYVVAIGAITNVASALLLEPRIVDCIVVVWLGGHPGWYDHTMEFKLKQDVAAARIVFDCGVPLVQIPCLGMASHLLTTVPELEAHLNGRGAV